TTWEKGLGVLWDSSVTISAQCAAAAVKKRCFLPKVVGRCRAAFPRWWYDPATQTCQKFTYGGCGANTNNFLSEGKPQGAPLLGVGLEPASANPVAAAPSPEYCTGKFVTGPCRAAFPRWWFDSEKQTCRKFIYGGCRGSKNNFLNKDDCMRQCSGEEAGLGYCDPSSFSAVALAVLLAIMAAILLGSTVVFFVRLCKRNEELSLGTVWSTMDDKECLVSNAYTL
uniref:Serine peptidase inhibitor, Kunitz type 2 n=1 Tax=Sphenodon punctatus TaxID=8508 RepID=A0A8D0HA83_SPHPU